MYIDIGAVSGLVNLSCFVEDISDDILRLIRRNAPTLQYLKLYPRIRSGSSGLICDADNGEYIGYIMAQGFASKDTVARALLFKDAVPFPALWRLILKIRYLFEDDTMFRCNASTLESLDVGLDRLTVSTLQSHAVFMPTSYSKVHCVKVGHYGDLVPSTLVTAAECARFVLSIAPKAAVREMHDAFTNAAVMPVFSSDGNHTCIQVLALPRPSLTFWDVVTLVKSLPLLTDLYTSPPMIGQPPTGVTMDRMPAYMRSSYALLDERLRCWHFMMHIFGDDDEVVMCVLPMALACSNFTYAAPSIGRRRSLMEKIEKTITTDGFKHYAPRLRCLLFNGWDKC
ncbi:hypothetical protein IWW38_001003 [Coemansia aciculifera]|uniref:Uncharacterized protein n=1 Tax=Coemansia aciculifera TaxID=417176 RepID=A0ACC1M960_9FUNG|nr:hypothetical protein IWW38_001003 [Coemansia aciculifera]